MSILRDMSCARKEFNGILHSVLCVCVRCLWPYSLKLALDKFSTDGAVTVHVCYEVAAAHLCLFVVFRINGAANGEGFTWAVQWLKPAVPPDMIFKSATGTSGMISVVAAVGMGLSLCRRLPTGEIWRKSPEPLRLDATVREHQSSGRSEALSISPAPLASTAALEPDAAVLICLWSVWETWELSGCFPAKRYEAFPVIWVGNPILMFHRDRKLFHSYFIHVHDLII